MPFNPLEFPAPPAMDLVWKDDFNGPSIDLNKWEIRNEPRRNHFWDKEDAYIENGHLVLRTRKGSDGKYHSGAISTMNKYQPTYGYFEARMFVCKYSGHWPAFWLFTAGALNIDNSGVDGTEIDIIEAPYSRTINLALHWDGYGADHKSANHQVDIAGLREAWHTFGLWWKSNEYVFYVDGIEVWKTNAGGVSRAPSFIFLTDEVDNWGGIIDVDLDYTYVDYVRVFQILQSPII